MQKRLKSKPQALTNSLSGLKTVRFTGEPISIMPTRDTAVLYARFMHDIQLADRGAAISADYLVIRSMEKPGG
jgi:hypothetical protein